MKLQIYITPQIYIRGPNVKIITKEKIYDFLDFRGNKIECILPQPPIEFTIMHHGKSNNDLSIQNNQIVHDTGFTINTIKIDEYTLTNEIFQFDTCFSDGKKLKGNNYFGDNCYMTFNIDKPIDFWIFDLKSKNYHQSNFVVDIDKFIAEILS